MGFALSPSHGIRVRIGWDVVITKCAHYALGKLLRLVTIAGIAFVQVDIPAYAKVLS